jgi:hypothetical protein
MALAVALGGAALFASAYRMDRHWIEIHMTPHSCAEHPAELVRGNMVRWAGLVTGTLLLVASPFVLRWARRRTPRDVASSALSITAAALLALVASDLVLRWRAKPPPAGQPLWHYEPDSEGDPEFVYRAIRSHVTEPRVGDKVLRFVIDANGYRVRSLDDVVDFERPTILFTGESVASGFGLNYEETYPFMVGEHLGVQSINVAVQGYGSDWAYMRLSEELPRFKHVVATVTLLHHMLVDRNVWTDRPHWLVDDEGTHTLVPRKEDDDGWLARSPLLHLFSDVYHSDEGLRRTRSYITATVRETRAHGGFPLFVLTNCGMPCMPDPTGAPSIERTLFDGLDATHVRVDMTDEVFDPAIGHPNRNGQARIAEAIETALRAHGIETLSH